MKKLLFAFLALLALFATSCLSSPAPVADFFSLVNRLEEAGATVENTGQPVNTRHLSVQGQALVINGGRLGVFEYDEAVWASREFRSLTDLSVPGIVIFKDGKPNLGETISTSTRVYHSGRFIVLYFDEDEGALNALKETLGRALPRK